MKRSHVKKLIRKYEQGKASPAERYIVERWYASVLEDPDDQLTYPKNGLSSFQDNVLSRAVLSGSMLRWYQKPGLLQWAAVIGLLLAFSIYFFIHPKGSGQDPATDPPLLVSTGLRQVKHIRLPDQTVIYLNANSRLEVLPKFGQAQRAVRLIGEASFDVAQDAKAPFLVQTERLSVHVMGTAFNIHAYPKLSQIRIAVSQGQIQVSRDTVVLASLRKDDQLVYSKSDGRFRMSVTNAVEQTTWQTGVTVLDRANFEELTQVIYNNYGVMLCTDEKAVKDARYHFTVRSNRTLEQTMDMICHIIHRKFKKEGARVLIY